MKMIQWFQCGSLDSISPLCIAVGRILTFSNINFKTLSFTLPTTIEKIDVRLGDVPVLITTQGTIKGYIQIVQYLKDRGISEELYPVEKKSRAMNKILSEWSMYTFFPISTYLTYKVDKNFEDLKVTIIENQALPKDQLDIAIKNLKKMLINNFHQNPIFSLNHEKANLYLHSHLELIEELLNENEYLVDGQLRLADITTYSALSRLFYIYKSDMSEFKDKYKKLFVWIQKVDTRTNGPRCMKAFHLF